MPAPAEAAEERLELPESDRNCGVAAECVPGARKGDEQGEALQEEAKEEPEEAPSASAPGEPPPASLQEEMKVTGATQW